jgi:hypothetical protein
LFGACLGGGAASVPSTILVQPFNSADKDFLLNLFVVSIKEGQGKIVRKIHLQQSQYKSLNDTSYDLPSIVDAHLKEMKLIRDLDLDLLQRLRFRLQKSEDAYCKRPETPMHK